MRQIAAAASGVVGGLAIILGLPLLTWLDAAWLTKTGWTPVARNRIQWPSLLLLGPHGGAMTLVLFTAALGTLAFAARIRALSTRRLAGAFAGTALAVALVAVPPRDDAPTLVALHNGAYGALLVLWCVTVILSLGDFPNPADTRRVRLLALGCVVLFGSGLLASISDATGQLARYFIIFPSAGWIAGLAWLTRPSLHGRPRPGPRRPQQRTPHRDQPSVPACGPPDPGPQ
jgi:hypothetical protein